jgi:hypothetical protein
LAGRIIVSPVFARLLFFSPIFGSHVSKDYSRKSRFDKASKHFFRENLRRPAIPGRRAACSPGGRHADRDIHPRRRRPQRP